MEVTHILWLQFGPYFRRNDDFQANNSTVFGEIAVILLGQYNGTITLSGTFIMIVGFVYQ